MAVAPPEPKPTPQPAYVPPPMRWWDWVILAGIALGALGGAGLIVSAIVIATGAAKAPSLPTGVNPSDLAEVIVAGATLLLAVFTALLAWVTQRSVSATQHEADIAARALAASIRQADNAEKSLQAAQDQVEYAKRQVEATEDRTRFEREQYDVTVRPLLTTGSTQFDDKPDPDQPFELAIDLSNRGSGRAFIAKGFLARGSLVKVATAINPKIISPGDSATFLFTFSPTSDATDRTIAASLRAHEDGLHVGALYRDEAGRHAWRSRGRLTAQWLRMSNFRWMITDVDIDEVDKALLS